jgi:hypothetical protein
MICTGGLVVDDRKLRVSKLSAARRQLDCAIELWFLDKDDVSIQTLAAAAYQIIHDLNQKKGGVRDLLYDSVVVKDEYRTMWVTTIKESVNFFKHADNDPGRTIEFRPFSSVIFMMFSLLGLNAIGEQTNDVEDALTTWISIHEPNFLKESYRKLLAERVPMNTLAHVGTISKCDFLKAYLRVRAEIRVKGLAQ